MKTNHAAPLGLVCCLTVLFSSAPAFSDVFVFKDKQGVLTFTNVPAHAGYRRVLRESNGEITVGAPAGSVASPTSYDELIRASSDRYNVDPELVRAVIKVESDFNSGARSNKGAMGLMQLMPDTARLHNVLDSFNPIENIEGGVRHLRLLLDRFQGDLQLSLAAYNAGMKAVEKHGGIPPFNETREYVRRVLSFYQSYRNNAVQISQQAQ
ncbi:MAG TPA: lytic transglycosylase domain-containing protein [Candidatus Binatia bacterium]|jgi:soluble lytic murein transglycosylase